MKDYLKTAIYSKGGYVWAEARYQERRHIKRSGKAKIKQLDKKTFQEIFEKGLDK